MSERLTFAGVPVILNEPEGKRPMNFNLTWPKGAYTGEKRFTAWPTVRKGDVEVANPVLDEIRKAAAEGTCVTVTYTAKPNSFVNSEGKTVNSENRNVWEVVPGGTPGEGAAAPSRRGGAVDEERIKEIARQVAREEIASWGIKKELGGEQVSPAPDYDNFAAQADWAGFNSTGIEKRAGELFPGKSWRTLDATELDALAASLGFALKAPEHEGAF